MAGRIRSATAEPVPLSEAAVRVGMNVGAAAAEPGQDASAVLRTADRGMYAEKTARRLSTLTGAVSATR